MHVLVAAGLSLDDQLTQIGALAGLAAIPGLAVMSLLYFGQAREIKRLREWAGRAPERAAELEQRIAADAQRRVQPQPARPSQPATPAAKAAQPATANGAPGAAPAAAGATASGTAQPATAAAQAAA